MEVDSIIEQGQQDGQPLLGMGVATRDKNEILLDIQGIVEDAHGYRPDACVVLTPETANRLVVALKKAIGFWENEDGAEPVSKNNLDAAGLRDRYRHLPSRDPYTTP